MSDLKPCPYCGGEAHLSADTSRRSAYFIGCETEECSGLMMWAERKDVAIAAWNTRTIDPAAIREAALREAEKALRDWQDALNANRFPETAITVGVAADAILDLIDKPTPDHSATPGNMIDKGAGP